MSDLSQENATPRKVQWPPWLLVPFVLLWCVIMLFIGYRNLVAWRERGAIRAMLHAPDAEFVVKVNGRPVSNSNGVLEAIRGIHLRMAHHTHPEHEIPVEIRSDHGVLELTLARDSALPREYWVFWTGEEGDPNRLEIGSIQTSAFDGQ